MTPFSIRARLILSMATMAILLVASCTMSVLGLSHANARIAEMYGNRMTSAFALGESMTDLLRARTAIDRVVLEPDAADSRQTLQRAQRFSERSDAAWRRYLALDAAPEERQLSDAVQAQRSLYFAQGQQALLAALADGRHQQARALMLQRMAPLFTGLSAEVEKLAAYQTERAAQLYQQSQDGYRQLLWWTGAGLLLALLVVAVSSTLLTRAIVAPVALALSHMEAIGGGDLARPVLAGRRDEMGRMMLGLEGMRAGLTATVRSVRDSSAAIGAATRAIAEGAVSLSARTESQASALEETASSMEQLTATVQHNAAHAKRAAALAHAAKDKMSEGNAQVGKLAALMQEVLAASQRIADITGLIESIAFQTNILALNAAVEAARAGEQGRGFAVVAAEVRMLAQRCSHAARDVGGQIATSLQLARSGAVLASATGASVAAILDNIEEVRRIVAEISAAGDEQAAGIEQVSQAVLQMDQLTQHNAMLVEESVATSGALQEQAAALERMVDRFSLDEGARRSGAAAAAAGRLLAA